MCYVRQNNPGSAVFTLKVSLSKLRCCIVFNNFEKLLNKLKSCYETLPLFGRFFENASH